MANSGPTPLIWGESREAWVVCFIAMIMAVFAWGTVFYGNGIYLPFLHKDRGWSVSAISLAMLFFALAGVTATLIVGRLVDRVSPAMALVWGALTIGPGLILIGRVDHLWQLYFVYCLFGMGYPALGTAGVSAILSLWFRQRYGLGLALSLSGASIGGSIFPVTMAWLSENIGFATTTLGFGVFLIVVIIPLAVGLLILDRRRVDGGLTAAADVTGDGLALVARRPLFWVVTGACGLTLGAQVGFLQHQINFLSIDVTVVVASLVVTVTVFAGALGRFLFGWLSARSHPRLLLAACSTFQAMGLIGMVVAPEFTGRTAASIGIGFVVGAIVMLPPILVRFLFGSRDFGQVYSLTNVALYIGMGSGPWITGVIHDAAGSYHTAFLMLAGCQLLAATILVFARPAH
ncbi:MAG: MFS transporter [Rhodospirillaceae bacterium]